MTVTLKGMTWSHPRGYDPMIACSRIWRERTGVELVWDKRSLQDFESYPVEELARAYDLIVIDHPHVGQITSEGCLHPLDAPNWAEASQALARRSVGPSFASYTWEGRQWALPIDAATQVQAFRPDLLSTAPGRLEEIFDLAREGRVLVPLRNPHAIMCFFTLSANLGTPCAQSPDRFVDEDAGVRVYDLLQQLLTLIPRESLDMDPIEASEAMARADSRIASIPLTYGYVSYARDGFRERRLDFAPVPSAGSEGGIGGTLGGTGIAVSARSANIDAAMEFAYWLAGEEAQKGPYAAAGGQPAHAAAWEDDTVNRDVCDFYRKTRTALETSYLRPRYNGYMLFQVQASDCLAHALAQGQGARDTVRALNALYRAAQAA
ncbi:extracellular solute-binding protein [Aureimonas frigidaquae]|uniref:Extracellular solute-binding protein n=1 Tax=Aureimonas frigidaquae TaxID=424757 RepID=A0A0P0Z3W1_9HYPH|nr:extracellular solute-binding protein [Aureimonas frigidaquae]BAT28595.1 hypothetical protein [Aureimonas frigidaquae]